MNVYKTKPKQVEHALRWEGFNALEFEEILCGYCYFARQYGDQLKVGTGPCSFDMLELGDWAVVIEGRVKLFSDVNFNHEFELVEI